jgi:hypothetical protein
MKKLSIILSLSVFIVLSAQPQGEKRYDYDGGVIKQYKTPWQVKRMYTKDVIFMDTDEWVQNWQTVLINAAVWKEWVENNPDDPGYEERLLFTQQDAEELSMNVDATEFALTFNISGTERLFYLNPGEQILQEFSYTFGFQDKMPVINHDGSKIFFVSDRFNNQEIFMAEYAKFEADRNYTVDFIVDNFSQNIKPSINQDGSKLAYQSLKEDGKWQVYVRDLMENTEVMPTSVRFNNHNPRLSADGNHLVYYVETSQTIEIWYSDLVNQVNINIMNDADINGRSDLSSDGSRIVFESSKNGRYDVYMLDRNELIIYNMTQPRRFRDGSPGVSKSEDRYVSISDDGQVLCFESEGKWDTKAAVIYDFNLNTVFTFRERSHHKISPQLSKDGNTLIYKVGDVLMRVDLNRVRELYQARNAGA